MPNNTKTKSDGAGESTGEAVNEAWNVDKELEEDEYQIVAKDIHNITKDEWKTYWKKQGYSDSEAEEKALEEAK